MELGHRFVGGVGDLLLCANAGLGVVGFLGEAFLEQCICVAVGRAADSFVDAAQRTVDRVLNRIYRVEHVENAGLLDDGHCLLGDRSDIDHRHVRECRNCVDDYRAKDESHGGRCEKLSSWHGDSSSEATNRRGRKWVAVRAKAIAVDVQARTRAVCASTKAERGDRRAASAEAQLGA